jgi:hypothetical protein
MVSSDYNYNKFRKGDKEDDQVSSYFSQREGIFTVTPGLLRKG